MGLEELQADIAADYKAKVEELKKDTEKKAKSILAQAEDEARKTLEKARQEAEAESKALQRRRLAASRLAADRIVSAAREKVVEGVLGDVQSALGRYAESPEYRRALPGYVEKAKTLIRGGFTVHARKNDAALLSGYDVKADLDAIGGAALTSKDSTVTIDATLERAYAQMRPKMRQEIYRRLFR